MKWSEFWRGLLNKAVVGYLLPILLWLVLCHPPDFFVFISLQAIALQIGVMWLLAVALFPLFQMQRYIVAHLVGIAALVFYLYPKAFPKVYWTKHTSEVATFKALHLNVHDRNTQHQRLIDQVLAQKADLVTLIEVNHRWAKALQAGLKQGYPYYFIYPVDNAFSGMAVFAKYPLENVQYILEDEPPTIAGNIHLPQGEIHFISSHTSAPILQGRIKRRYQQLDKLAQEITEHQDLPVLLLGDFNAVPWERLILDFKQQTQMQATRSGLQNTFPTWALWAGIPIDYIFYSSQLVCYGNTVFQYTGSDHVGLVGEFGWRQEEIKEAK
ncbi:MAG TPA: hypothetical protein DCS93_33200 [Microscillaceae bacterium]|nr:hypothetical protein [Microscillaceae bacterium]